MIDLKVLHTKKLWPRGFWFSLLWIFSIGMQVENDTHGKFIMISFGIHRILFHFTLALNNKDD